MSKIHDLFQCGRLCLFGEHTDWTSQLGVHRGFCIVTGIDQGIQITAQKGAPLTHSWRGKGPTDDPACSHIIQWRDDVLLEIAQEENHWYRFFAAVGYIMKTERGLGSLYVVEKRTDLPPGKGLSSSAAVCILLVRAYNACYDLNLLPEEIIDYAYRAELLTGSMCGQMDQACFYGKAPLLLSFTSAGPRMVRTEPIIVENPLHFLVIDLGGEKDTKRIINDLREAYSHSPSLRNTFGSGNEAIVRQAYYAIAAGDAKRVGKLMRNAQLYFRDTAAHRSPDLASPKLYDLLDNSIISEYTYGGKGVGSQGDGTAVFVAKSKIDSEKLADYINDRYPEMTTYPLEIS